MKDTVRPIQTFSVVLQVRELGSRRAASDDGAGPVAKAEWARIHELIDVPTLQAYGLEPLPDFRATMGTLGAISIHGDPLSSDWYREHLDDAAGVLPVKMLVYNALALCGPHSLPELHARVRKARAHASDSSINGALAELRDDKKIETVGNKGSYLYRVAPGQSEETCP
jgi:hypothetical protein